MNIPCISADPCNPGVPNWHPRILPFQVGGCVLAYPARQQRNVNVPLLAECIKSTDLENPQVKEDKESSVEMRLCWRDLVRRQA